LNTGTHVGHLWSSTGTLLATATFTGETGSGWQQVTFSTPVAIAANTVYVASYHCLGGHYSADRSFFATQGVDSPPLHLLASGASGGNGVYGYGAAGTFPAQSYQASNYWVDVVFSPTTVVTLSAITVNPSAPAIAPGATQQFAATGTYSDASTQSLTAQVIWTSSNLSVATISATGLATGAGLGTTTISATLGAIHGSATLTVQAAPLSITTTSLLGGTQGVAYAATLTRSGGVAPYTWSIASGLPPGVTLDPSTGLLSGTPTLAGVYDFTAQVTDANAGIATKPLSITITPPSAVSITTASLPGGTQGISYSAPLAASGGVVPYTWSTGSGLPPGLSINPSSGVISGTPTAVGVYSFTAQATDAVAQTATRTLSLTIVAQTNLSAWPSTAVPTRVDIGLDSPVELGVKFRSDTAGSITALRFYKAALNTGTHVGHLWSSTGTLLATATFVGETGSGWQQVTFSAPVAIAANTIYVASYHCPGGHYSADLDFFATQGVDSPPLHLLASGASGGNGVYRYGGSGTFPALSYHSSNYWVDVVFSPTPP